MNRTYEIMFIVRPDVEEADLDKLIEGFSANVTSGGGEVKSVEKMGRLILVANDLDSSPLQNIIPRGSTNGFLKSRVLS